MTDKQTLESLKKIFGMDKDEEPEIKDYVEKLDEWDKSIDKLRELLGMSNRMDKKD
jgi:hypothetical protein